VQGATSLPLLQGILLQSRFGVFLGLRIALSVSGIICLNVPVLRGSLRPRNLAWILPLFGLLLTLVFEYSGHGGAATVWWGPIIDYLHLVAMGIWLGGLFTLALFILPALSQRPAAERLTYLSTSLPAFSVPALVAAALLATTGPLNADARMTSLDQLWTTGYGVVLLIKIGLFLVMIAISYYHAFRLRPHLALQLGATGQSSAPAPMWAQVPLVRWLEQRMALFEQWQAPHSQPALAVSGADSAATMPRQDNGNLAQQIQGWLRVEAGIGVAVLLCAMLLGPLAGTLAPKIVTTNSFGASGGSQSYTQTADQLKVTLAVTPGKFGTNTVTVVVINPDGSPASGGSVELLTEMVEMDMGENAFQLTATSAPGTYSGAIQLPMAGHWKITTRIRTQQDPQHLHSTTFTVSASY
jgi:copper transport protein